MALSQDNPERRSFYESERFNALGVKNGNLNKADELALFIRDGRIV